MNARYRKFELGRVVATPAALELMEDTFTDVMILLARHVAGDWGNLDAEDKKANNDATHIGARILSAYNITDSKKIWILTEADRSSTCVMLPSDY